MSSAERDYTHGVDLVTFETSKKPHVEQLVYEPQHKIVVLPENDEALTPKKMKTLIDATLDDRNDGQLDERFRYVFLKVTMEKMSAEEIHDLEEAVNEKNAKCCKIQRILPQIDVTTIAGSKKLRSIDDILNRAPMETLKEAYLIAHGVEMSKQQETLLDHLLGSIKNESTD